MPRHRPERERSTDPLLSGTEGLDPQYVVTFRHDDYDDPRNWPTSRRWLSKYIFRKILVE